jgi:MoaA/NifB/PqqE/SkfB family radical SAM enzyme
MNFYQSLKYLNRIKSPRLKLFGIYLMHIFGKRYLGVFIDPALACNLRCKMCYFSDDEKRKAFKGMLSWLDIAKIAEAFFHRALKVQIGCGAEPTVYKQAISELILLAKKHRVPYVSLTTNGILLNEDDVRKYISEGLDEITLSMHGVTKETYEFFMTNSNYDTFCQVLKFLTEVKKDFPQFQIRINYTMNEDNFLELKDFFDYFEDINIDVMQLRPIQKIGNSEYNNFSHKKQGEMYDEVIQTIKEKCREKHITCIAPPKIFSSGTSGNTNSVITESTYCYVSPAGCWEDDFDYRTDTFESYATRTKLARKLLKNVFFRKKHLALNEKRLNYEIV